MSHTLNAVEGKMKKTQYYSGVLNFAAIKKLVKLPQEAQWNDIFEGDGDTEGQRKLNKPRVNNNMVPYVIDNDDAFYSAVTLVMVPYTGEEAKEGADYSYDPETLTLKLEDHVDLFVADGKHRISSVLGGMEQAPDLYTHQIPVVLLPFKDKNAVKQVFSDLNLNAKAIGKSQGYAFEQRDPKVLLSLAVIENVLVFTGRVNKTTNNLSARSKDVVTLSTMVSSNLEIMTALRGKSEKDLAQDEDWRSLRKRKPNDPEIVTAASSLIEFWNIYTSKTPGWDKLGKEGGVTAGQLRDGIADNQSGYVSAFGVGFQAAANAYAALIRDRGEEEAKKLIALCLTNVDWQKGEHWAGLAMIGTRVNNTGPGIKASAGYILHKGGVIPNGDDTKDKSIKSLLQQMQNSVADQKKAAGA